MGTGWGYDSTCTTVGYKTDFAASDLDGYKKCICSYKQAGDPNCEQSTDEANKDPEAQECGAEPPTPGPTPDKSPLEELIEMLYDIKGKPHFDSENMSSTTW